VCDSFNHFVCPDFPAHSHWKMTSEDSLEINWGKYGEYELTFDPATGSWTGNKKGAPSNWRKASFMRALTPEALSASSHDHAHEHVHTADCKH
jgi:hypothetical protein